MNETHKAVMSEVLGEVLEKFAYMFIDPVPPSDISIEEHELLEVTMSFKGPMKGRFGLLVPKEACREITANILGFEEDDEFVGSHLEDGAKELLNIVGAHVLSKIGGDGSDFDISIPEANSFDVKNWSSFVTHAGTVAFVGDSKPIIFQVNFD